MEFQSVKQDWVLGCGIRAAVIALRGMRQRPLSSFNESGFIIYVWPTVYQVYLFRFYTSALKTVHLLSRVIHFNIGPASSINFLTLFYGCLWKSNFSSGNCSYEHFYLLTLHHRWNLLWWKAFVKRAKTQLLKRISQNQQI